MNDADPPSVTRPVERPGLHRRGQVQRVWCRVAGLRIHTRVSAGAAEAGRMPVVLVHGLGISSAYMVPAAERLAAYVQVYAPDLPGFGKSDRPAVALDVGQMAGFLDDWATQMGLDRAVWAGNSFGCQVIVELALRRSDRVAGLVLQGMTPDADRPSYAGHVARLALDAFREPPALVYLAARDYLRAGVGRCWQTFGHLLADPVAEKLGRVAAPAVVVRGERDPLVSAGWAAHAAALLPRGRLVVVPGAAHGANYSHPEAFASVVLGLAETLSAPRGNNIPTTR